MWIEHLDVSGVRNLEDTALDPSPGLNLFFGANGAGKTALLEAIHVLARGRSFRGTRVLPVIHHDKRALMIRARIHDEARGSVDVALGKDRDNVADLRIAGQAERRVSAAAALMPLQLFLPDGAELIFGGPGIRRRFLDWGVFHVKHRYLENLQAYQRALRQRNSLLTVCRSRGMREQELDAWTRQLVALAEPVDDDRRAYVEALAEPVVAAVAQLAGEAFPINVEYRPGWPPDATFAEALGESVARDVKFAATQYGPHRAELRLSAGAGIAAETLSRGQGKLLASALRLAQVHLARQLTGRGSLLLIDDLGAELDRTHSHRFFQLLAESECQVFATSVEAQDLSEFGSGRRTMFHVEQGQITCRPMA